MVKWCPRPVLSQSQFLLSSLDTLGLVTMSAVISLIPLLISQPSVHPLLVLWPQGFPGRFVGASFWRCALGTPVSLYLLVSLLTCSSLVPRSRLVWRIRLSVVPRSIAGGIFSNFRPGPILAGSSIKAPVDPPRLLWVHSLTCFTFMSLKWSRNPIRPQASSRGSPRNHVFGLLSASNLANSVREAPADCFSNFWVHASLLSLSSTHFSHISHKPRLLFLSFLFFFFHLASIHSVFSSSPNSPLFLLSSLEFWLVGDLSLFLKLVSLVLFL